MLGSWWQRLPPRRRDQPGYMTEARGHGRSLAGNHRPGALEYLDENGLFLLAQKTLQVIQRRTRDQLLARSLRTRGLRLGSRPKLRGLKHMRIGEAFSAGDDLWLEAVLTYQGMRYDPLITIGRNVNFSDQVHIACIGRVSLGDGVLCGSKVLITDHDHGRYAGTWQSAPEEPPGSRPLFSAGGVSIGDNVFVGDGVVILAGAHIGPGSVIAANSVVKGTIPACCVAAGLPARVVRRWDAQLGRWRREE
jgi:acetyltransferase-like isoleucine patch superfamily enzyme